MSNSAGTVFYRIPEETLKQYYKDDRNIVMRYLTATEGFNAFNTDILIMDGGGFDDADGSFILCLSDGEPITIDGEEVEPYEALEEYGVEGIQDYIQDGGDEQIRRYFSTYDLAPIDVDDVADGLFHDGWTFTQILDDLEAIDLLDRD